MPVLLKRVYDPPAADDGFRILVDRLWPRGLSRDRAQVDLWLKEVGPSNELRHWFDHRDERYDEFTRRYADELHGSDAVRDLRDAVDAHTTSTLLFGAKNVEHNQAVALVTILQLS